MILPYQNIVNTLLTFGALLPIRKLPNILVKKSFEDEEAGEATSPVLFIGVGVDEGNDAGHKLCFNSFNFEVLDDVDKGGIFWCAIIDVSICIGFEAGGTADLKCICWFLLIPVIVVSINKEAIYIYISVRDMCV